MKKFVVLLLVALLIVIFAVPAFAADPITLWRGDDVGKVNANRDAVFVWDHECDGNQAYIDVDHENPFNSKKVFDPNGCQSGSGTDSIGTNFYRARLCEERDTGFDACTPWSQEW